MAIRSMNPATGEVIKKYSLASDGIVKQAITHATSAYLEWKKQNFTNRSKLFHQLAEILLQNSQKHAKTISLEMGKPITEAIAEIEKCAKLCKYYADNGKFFLMDEMIIKSPNKAMIRYEPLGIILGIMPWNYPFWQAFRFLVPTIMSGNACILKHANIVPQCGKNIEKLFSEAGFPDGVVTNLLIDHKKTSKIIENDAIQGVSLTGSEGAGSAVAALAGKNIKKSLLELGGSGAFIVLDDANLKTAVKVGVQARFQNAGQSCIAAKRFIVTKTNYDQFVELLQQEVEALKIGDPLLAETQMGPLASVKFVDDFLSQIKQSVKKGAQLIYGGKRQSKKNAFVTPAILTNVTPGMPAFNEETFGPIAAVIKAEDAKDAIALANNSKFGLGASIWTEDEEKGLRYAKQLHVGSVYVNGMVASDPRLPFGGIKKSGYGRELSHTGIREFVNIKTIVIN